MSSKQPPESEEAVSGEAVPSTGPRDLPDAIRSIALHSANGSLPEEALNKFADEFSKIFLSSLVGPDGGTVLQLGISKTIQKVHSGPLPPAETLEGYNQVVQGGAERVFAMAERDQAAYIETHRIQQKSDNRFRIISYVGGFIALCTILGVGTLLAFYGLENPSLAVFTLGAVSIISVFVNAWKSKPS